MRQSERFAAPGVVPQWVVVVALVAILAGVACRFSNATHKVYYQDEAVTSVRAAGYELDDIGRMFDRHPHTYGDVARFVVPGADRSLASTVKSLVDEDPQHPPVFYVMEGAWSHVAGAGSLAMRSLAVALSLLALPLIFALALELFGTRTTAWIATALFAVSPFFVLYAYQAREYGLFAATVALASVLFLRARRLGGRGRWAAYGAAVALGCYTYLFFAFALVVHGIVALTDLRRRPRAFGAFLLSALAGVAAFLPWLRVFVDHRATAAADVDWATSAYPLAYIAAKWAFFSAGTFFDLEYLDSRFAVVALAVLVLEAVALVELVRRGPARSALFVVALGATAFVALAIPDLVLHHRFSTIPRYLVTTWMALVLAVAAWFGRRPDSRITRLGFPALVCAALAASATSSVAGSWWENNGSRAVPAAARYLAAHPGTVVAGFAEEFPLLDLALMVAPQGHWIGYMPGQAPPLEHSIGTTYLLSPSSETRARLAARGKRLSLAYDSHDFATNLSRFRSGVSGQHAGDNDWGEIVLWRVDRP
ncbi:MAG: hypothetical protein NVS4B5_07510 [Vulcanimicrobiaceae bacterium]